MIFLCDEVQGQFCNVDISQVGLVKHLPIVYQRHEVCAAQSHHAAAYLLPQRLFQSPGVDAHQQGGAQSVDTHQWIAHNSCDYDKDQSQTVALG